MENINNNVEVTPKVITFSSLFMESLQVCKSLFKDYTSNVLLLLILLMVPIVNLFVAPFIMFIIGRKIQGENNPFTGSVKLYFSKFWNIVSLMFVYLGMIFWKTIIWILLPIVFWGLLKVIGVHSAIMSSILNTLIPILIIVFPLIFMLKYFCGWRFAVNVLLFEDKKNKDALNRSWELTDNRKWDIFFYFLILGLIAVIYSVILIVTISSIFRLDSVLDKHTLSIIRSVITSPISFIITTFFTILYFKFKNK
ncbi:MAG: hypothetical protein NTZ44_03365 [Candidatus Nomurabacteria bacterium]|nr:hypothetical protein [Candidatus Nomurabacteria bacterium]